MENDNTYEKMKTAEWQGWAGATLESLKKQMDEVNANIKAICARVDLHDINLMSINEWRLNVKERQCLSGKAKGIIAGAAIGAIASIIVALISLLSG